DLPVVLLGVVVQVQDARAEEREEEREHEQHAALPGEELDLLPRGLHAPEPERERDRPQDERAERVEAHVPPEGEARALQLVRVLEEVVDLRADDPEDHRDDAQVEDEVALDAQRLRATNAVAKAATGRISSSFPISGFFSATFEETLISTTSAATRKTKTFHGAWR